MPAYFAAPASPLTGMLRHNLCFPTFNGRFSVGHAFGEEAIRRRTKLPMKTIFLIEDDAVVVKVYGAKFEREGFRVEVAEDGLVAMKKLLQVKPDVVVLDLMMPKLNGVDVLRNTSVPPRP